MKDIYILTGPLSVQVHLGNPNMARIPELTIRQMPVCEGGGWYMPADQAQALVEVWNNTLAIRANAPELTDAMIDAGFAAIEEYEGWKKARKSPRPTLVGHIWQRMNEAPTPHRTG